LRQNPQLLAPNAIKSIKIVAYQPAFGIIGDPAKRDPTTRQSADHSMVYIVATLLKKAIAIGSSLSSDGDEAWKQLILTPSDYSRTSISSQETRQLMSLIEFAHGGKEYDDKYPEGIPTSVVFTDNDGKQYDSGLVMFPAGHASNTTAKLDDILHNKFAKLGELAVDDVEGVIKSLSNLESKSSKEIDKLYNIDIQFAALKRKASGAGSAKKAKRHKGEAQTEEQTENEY